MDRGIGNAVTAVLMVVFALVGLIAAAGARDDEMYVFGFSLLAFAFLFLFGMVKKHFDHAGRAAAPARSTENPHV